MYKVNVSVTHPPNTTSVIVWCLYVQTFLLFSYVCLLLLIYSHGITLHLLFCKFLF